MAPLLFPPFPSPPNFSLPTSWQEHLLINLVHFYCLKLCLWFCSIMRSAVFKLRCPCKGRLCFSSLVLLLLLFFNPSIYLLKILSFSENVDFSRNLSFLFTWPCSTYLGICIWHLVRIRCNQQETPKGLQEEFCFPLYSFLHTISSFCSPGSPHILSSFHVSSLLPTHQPTYLSFFIPLSLQLYHLFTSFILCYFSEQLIQGCQVLLTW